MHPAVQHRFGVPTLLLAALVASTSCTCSKDEKKENPKVTAAEKPKKTAQKPKPPRKPEVDRALVALAKKVQTQEDFEKAAEKDIVAENLEAKLDEIARELDTPPE